METAETYYRVYVDGELLCRCDTEGKAEEVYDYMISYYGPADGVLSICKVTIVTTEKEI